MKVQRFIGLLFAAMLAGALAGCNVQPAGVSTDEHAAENRQYMALLNQKTGELEDVLGQFQAAVSAGDAVGIKAATSDAGKIVEAIAAAEATESLADVKDAYVAGLTDINSAMNAYADLYANVAAGKVSQVAFDREVKTVQADYDKAVEKLKAADDLLTQLANE